jgi:hypothetical protein
LRRENQIALGIILIFLGLLAFVFSNVTVNADNYVLRSSLDNSNTASPKVSVSGHFEAGEHFFFNFTKGHYWGVKYDVENGGMEPTDPLFAPNASIPSHKIVSFDMYTPSGDVLETSVYVVGGTDVYAVVYNNQSSDFVPLNGNNLTLYNVGMEGRIVNGGNYTVKAIAIVPLILRSLNQTYTIDTDPPLLMNLWTIQSAELKPYFVFTLSLSTVLLLAGAVLCIWAVWFRRKQARHAKTRNQK